MAAASLPLPVPCALRPWQGCCISRTPCGLMINNAGRHSEHPVTCNIQAAANLLAAISLLCCHSISAAAVVAVAAETDDNGGCLTPPTNGCVSRSLVQVSVSQWPGVLHLVEPPQHWQEATMAVAKPALRIVANNRTKGYQSHGQHSSLRLSHLWQVEPFLQQDSTAAG